MQSPGGPPLKRRRISRIDAFTLVVGPPFCLTLLAVEAVRIWGAINGEPLLITGLFGFDVKVEWSDGWLPFFGGVALHAAIIAFALLALWGLYDHFQRWRGWRRQ